MPIPYETGCEGRPHRSPTSDGGQLVVTVPSQAEYQLMNVSVAVKAMSILRRNGLCWFSLEDIVQEFYRILAGTMERCFREFIWTEPTTQVVLKPFMKR